jgi:pyruvate formate lyase activating enzyme
MIKGIVPVSLIDWDGNICSVIFTGGCNYRCPYCHNPELIELNGMESIKEEKIFEVLDKKKKWIGGACVTGGEPLLHSEIKELIKKIKSRGLMVKLDTNGSNPELLKELIDEKLVDYVAMDIKAPKTKYSKVAGTNVNIDAVEKSVEILKSGKVDCEFRTTVVPGLLNKEDIIEITKWIKGAKRYYIQQFRPLNTFDKKYLEVEPYTLTEMEEIRDSIKGNFEVCELRNL